MIERHFVLNLDRINGERNADHPGKKQEIIRGKAFMHFYDADGGESHSTIRNMLVLAVERSYLQELFVQLVQEEEPENAPADISETEVVGVENLFEYLENDHYDPDHVYAAIIVQAKNL